MQKCSLGYKLDLVQNVGCRAHGGLLPRASGGRFRSKKKARGGRFRSKKKFNNAGLCAKKSYYASVSLPSELSRTTVVGVLSKYSFRNFWTVSMWMV